MEFVRSHQASNHELVAKLEDYAEKVSCPHIPLSIFDHLYPTVRQTWQTSVSNHCPNLPSVNFPWRRHSYVVPVVRTARVYGCLLGMWILLGIVICLLQLGWTNWRIARRSLPISNQGGCLLAHIHCCPSNRCIPNSLGSSLLPEECCSSRCPNTSLCRSLWRPNQEQKEHICRRSIFGRKQTCLLDAVGWKNPCWPHVRDHHLCQIGKRVSLFLLYWNRRWFCSSYHGLCWLQNKVVRTRTGHLVNDLEHLVKLLVDLSFHETNSWFLKVRLFPNDECGWRSPHGCFTWAGRYCIGQETMVATCVNVIQTIQTFFTSQVLFSFH